MTENGKRVDGGKGTLPVKQLLTWSVGPNKASIIPPEVGAGGRFSVWGPTLYHTGLTLFLILKRKELTLTLAYGDPNSEGRVFNLPVVETGRAQEMNTRPSLFGSREAEVNVSSFRARIKNTKCYREECGRKARRQWFTLRDGGLLRGRRGSRGLQQSLSQRSKARTQKDVKTT